MNVLRQTILAVICLLLWFLFNEFIYIPFQVPHNPMSPMEEEFLEKDATRKWLNLIYMITNLYLLGTSVALWLGVLFMLTETPDIKGGMSRMKSKILDSLRIVRREEQKLSPKNCDKEEQGKCQ